MISWVFIRWMFILAAAFTLWGAVRKPAFFWEHHKARTLRGILGDTGTTVLYIGIALYLAWFGIFGPVR